MERSCDGMGWGEAGMGWDGEKLGWDGMERIRDAMGWDEKLGWDGEKLGWDGMGAREVGDGQTEIK